MELPQAINPNEPPHIEFSPRLKTLIRRAGKVPRVDNQALTDALELSGGQIGEGGVFADWGEDSLGVDHVNTGSAIKADGSRPDIVLTVTDHDITEGKVAATALVHQRQHRREMERLGKQEFIGRYKLFRTAIAAGVGVLALFSLRVGLEDTREVVRAVGVVGFVAAAVSAQYAMHYVNPFEISARRAERRVRSIADPLISFEPKPQEPGLQSNE